jgi:hypothetical protein
MATNTPDERSGRETRLLVLVIVVAVGVLLVLARFRFPAAEFDTVTSTPGPIARLAARTTFEDLAATMGELIGRVTPSVVLVQLEPTMTGELPRDGSEIPLSRERQKAARLAPAIRLEPDLALLHLPAGMAVSADQMLTERAQLVVADVPRQVALVRVPEQFAGGSLPIPYDGFTGFSFVGVVEAATGGPTARPVFIGRADVSSDIRWTSPVLSVGGHADVLPGSLIFALDGRFVGLAMRDAGALVIVPTGSLAALANELQKAGGGASR